jgi:hypothetical protein
MNLPHFMRQMNRVFTIALLGTVAGGFRRWRWCMSVARKGRFRSA